MLRRPSAVVCVSFAAIAVLCGCLAVLALASPAVTDGARAAHHGKCDRRSRGHRRGHTKSCRAASRKTHPRATRLAGSTQGGELSDAPALAAPTASSSTSPPSASLPGGAAPGAPSPPAAEESVSSESVPSESVSTQSSPPTRRLVWSDEFGGPAGSSPNSSNWTFDTGGGGWGNNELESYT